MSVSTAFDNLVSISGCHATLPLRQPNLGNFRNEKESVREVLEVIAPGQSAKLWAALGDNVQAERSQAEIELLEALAESYFNASHWSTRRQILSIMADKI